MNEDTDDREFFGDRRIPLMLLYLADHDGCMMSELYRDVTGNRSRPEVLEAIERAGAVVRVREGRTTRIHLTAKGRKMGRMLKEAKAIYDEAVNDIRL